MSLEVAGFFCASPSGKKENVQIHTKKELTRFWLYICIAKDIYVCVCVCVCKYIQRDRYFIFPCGDVIQPDIIGHNEYTQTRAIARICSRTILLAVFWKCFSCFHHASMTVFLWEQASSQQEASIAREGDSWLKTWGLAQNLILRKYYFFL